MSRKVITVSMIAIVAFAAIAARVNAQAPGVPAQEVAPILDKAVGFLKSAQGADGSFSPKLAGPGVTARNTRSRTTSSSSGTTTNDRARFRAAGRAGPTGR